MKKEIVFLIIILNCQLLYFHFGFSQGRNHQFLIGYDTGLFDTNVTSTKARLLFNSNSVAILPETRKMAFRAAQGNISDENGNLLMVSNGCWIANTTGDTMQNGSGLNPGSFANDWCSAVIGIPFPHSNVIIPWPDDPDKFILFHQVGNYNLTGAMATELFYTVIDMTLDNGKGAVIQKNVIALTDTLNQGIAVCKHANGRDWWVCVLEENSNNIYKLLITPSGIASITTQSLGVTNHNLYNGQPVFSPDGNKFAYRFFYGPSGFYTNEVRLFDFDRCTGMISNPVIISWMHITVGQGISFSPDSKRLYTCTFDRIYQINTDTANIPASLQIVAYNDGYYSPYPPFQTDFWLMYLAANGKIYISSGNGVIDLHFINYPDSAGVSCNVQQHALHLPCYSARGNVNHPNYYLGCDTTQTTCPCLTDVKNLSPPDFKFRVYPNPVTDGYLNIGYLLPQNKSGVFEIYDITGKVVFSYTLPPWSNYQSFRLPPLSDGIYRCVIISDGKRVGRKLAVVRD